MSCVTGWLFSCFFCLSNRLSWCHNFPRAWKKKIHQTPRADTLNIVYMEASFHLINFIIFFSGFMWTVQWKHAYYQLLKFLMFQSQGNCSSIMILKCLLWISAAMWRTTCFALTRCPNFRACCSLAPQYVCSAPFIHLVKFTVPSVKVYFCLLFVLMK